MKAVLEFDLTEYEDRLEHKRAVSATNMYLAIHELDQHLRSKLKYDDSLSEDSYNTLENIREKLHEFLSEYGISLNDLE